MWFLSTVLFLFGVIFPLRCLLDKHDWRVLEPWEEASIFSLGKLTKTVRHAGLVFTMFWQKMRIIDTRDDVLDLPLEKLSTGGAEPMEFDVNLAFYFARTDPSKYTTKVAGDNPDAMLIPLVRGAVVTALNATEDNVLLNGGLPKVLASAATDLKDFCGQWGITARKLLVEDLGLPEALISAATARAKARGEADALKILSDMEIQTTRDQQAAQGKGYWRKETMDLLREIGGKGFGRVIGDLSALTNLIGADLLEEQEAKT